jgi:glycosyltransferase involved in cell wall biosynthesis
MKVLVIGSDSSIFRDGSPAGKRMLAYSSLFTELHLVIMTPRGFPEKSIGNLFFLPTNSRLKMFRWYDAFRCASGLADRVRPDLIDAENAAEAGLAAYLVSRRHRIPFRLQIHTDIMSPYYRRASWKERFRFEIARFLIPRSSCIRAVSERIKKSLVASFSVPASRISVLPIFTDTAPFFEGRRDAALEERLRKFSFKMVSAGRFLEREKNFFLLIDMMREFVKICPGAVLVLCGDGPDKQRYESMIARHALENHVMIEPWRSETASLFPLCDLFLLSSNYEGWGRVVIEAMAAGVAVVMTDVGLAGEVVRRGENGMVVPVGNKELFLAAVQELWQDPEKRRRLASRARQTVLAFEPRTRGEYLARYRSAYFCCV